MMPQPPSGQGPIDPRGAFSPPPPPGGRGSAASSPPSGWGAAPPPHSLHGMPAQMPMMMPPPAYFPPPPQRGGFTRAIFITLATTVFGISLMANIYLLMLSGLTGRDASTRSNVLVSGDPTQKIAVVPISGIIDSTSYQRFERIIKQLETDRSVKALVIEIDTPGGTVTASDEIYNRILKFKSETQIPVITTMGGLATSGGYYVACATDEIFAQPTTLTGNIGVIMQRFNFSGAMEKVGVQDTSITPEGAQYKDLGSPFRPETPEGTAYMRTFAEDFHGQFKTIVSTGRKDKLKDSVEKIADGRVYTAATALRLGLVDHQGYSTDAYDRAAALASLSNPTVIRYQHQPSFFEAFGVRWGGSTAGGIDVKLDPSVLNDLTTPRAMYLWRGE